MAEKPDFDGFSGAGGKPTAAERRLIEASQAGEPAICSGKDDDEGRVAADLIVALATEQFRHADFPGWSLHDKGLWFKGGFIAEKLDFRGRRTRTAVISENCNFQSGLDFNHADIGGNLFLLSSVVRGESLFFDTKISGQFVADGATFSNIFGYAIIAQGVTATGWFMDGAVVEGAIDIVGATLSSQFSANGATFKYIGGADPDLGLRFQFATIQGGVFFRNTEVAGDVSFDSATIDKRCDFTDAKITAHKRRALDFTRAKLTCDPDFSNTEINGSVAFTRATIEGKLNLASARIAADFPNRKGQYPRALILKEAEVKGRLILPTRKVEGIVDLSRATVETLEDHAGGWPDPLTRRANACDTRLCLPDDKGKMRDSQHLNLDGFHYQYFEHASGDARDQKGIGEARINWLSAQSADQLKTHFNPQPWRQCALVLRQMGYDEEAQQVTIARRIREREADGTRVGARFLNHILEKTSKYGFRPMRAVSWCVGVILVCYAVTLGALQVCGQAGVAAAPGGACGDVPLFVAVRYHDVEIARQGLKKEAAWKSDYPEFSAFWYSVDAFVPLLDFGMEGYWRSNTKAWGYVDVEQVHPTMRWWPLGWALYIMFILERVLGAILIAIAITGFTGLLTREERQT